MNMGAKAKLEPRRAWRQSNQLKAAAEIENIYRDYKLLAHGTSETVRQITLEAPVVRLFSSAPFVRRAEDPGREPDAKFI
jgi:hypothetical protein